MLLFKTADNGTKIRIFFLHNRGLSVLETTRPQGLSPLSRTPRLRRGIGRGKRFFLLQNDQTGSGVQQVFFQHMMGLSLRVHRPGRRVDMPRLRMSGTIIPLPFYALMLWTGITSHIIYRCGAPDSPHCTHGNLVQ